MNLPSVSPTQCHMMFSAMQYAHGSAVGADILLAGRSPKTILQGLITCLAT